MRVATIRPIKVRHRLRGEADIKTPKRCPDETSATHVCQHPTRETQARNTALDTSDILLARGVASYVEVI